MCCSTFPTHTRGVVATGRLLISSLLSPLCLFFFFFFRKTCRNCKLSLLLWSRRPKRENGSEIQKGKAPTISIHATVERRKGEKPNSFIFLLFPRNKRKAEEREREKLYKTLPKKKSFFVGRSRVLSGERYAEQRGGKTEKIRRKAGGRDKKV